jgi:hypothetical protein
MSTIETMTIKQLIEAHNELPGVEPITSWKGRKDLLVEKVAAAMKTARGNRTIREVAEALLIEVARTEDGKPIGHPYDYVLEQVLAEFPEANTTVKCLRWYNTKLNSDPNVKMPVRPRKKAVKADAPGQAVDVQADADEDGKVADPLA